MALINYSKSTWLSVNRLPIIYTAIRHHWNKHYKPRPFPKTQEERNRAAEKYGLLPSDYQPYPDDGTGLGDYPMLPDISGDSRDAFYPWDYPELKRNFNEPMHASEHLIDEVTYDVTTKQRVPGWLQWTQFLGVSGALFGVMMLCENFKMFVGAKPKQFPLTGETHYTFELKE